MKPKKISPLHLFNLLLTKAQWNDLTNDQILKCLSLANSVDMFVKDLTQHIEAHEIKNSQSNPVKLKYEDTKEPNNILWRRITSYSTKI